MQELIRAIGEAVGATLAWVAANKLLAVAIALGAAAVGIGGYYGAACAMDAVCDVATSPLGELSLRGASDSEAPSSGAVPEPSAIAALGGAIGLLGLALGRRRLRRNPR